MIIDPPRFIPPKSDDITLPYRDHAFACIEADPPWQYRDRGYNGRQEVQKYRIHTPYDTMSVDELIAMGDEVQRVSAPSCHLWMWTTKDFRFDAERIMRAWGFTFKNASPWVKTTSRLRRTQKGLKQFTNEEIEIAQRVFDALGMPGKPAYGMGHWLRPQHEALLLGVNDNSFRPLNATREPAMVFAPKTKHSAKPKQAYELIRRNSPGPRLSMFQRTEREGFTCWGNEL